MSLWALSRFPFSFVMWCVRVCVCVGPPVGGGLRSPWVADITLIATPAHVTLHPTPVYCYIVLRGWHPDFLPHFLTRMKGNWRAGPSQGSVPHSLFGIWYLAGGRLYITHGYLQRGMASQSAARANTAACNPFGHQSCDTS